MSESSKRHSKFLSLIFILKYFPTDKYIKDVISGTRQGLDLVLGHRDRARILAWVLEKIVCSH